MAGVAYGVKAAGGAYHLWRERQRLAASACNKYRAQHDAQNVSSNAKHQCFIAAPARTARASSRAAPRARSANAHLATSGKRALLAYAAGERRRNNGVITSRHQTWRAKTMRCAAYRHVRAAAHLASAAAPPLLLFIGLVSASVAIFAVPRYASAARGTIESDRYGGASAARHNDIGLRQRRWRHHAARSGLAAVNRIDITARRRCSASTGKQSVGGRRRRNSEYGTSGGDRRRRKTIAW